MNNSSNHYDALENLIFLEKIKIDHVEVKKNRLMIRLSNDLLMITSSTNYPGLKHASPSQLKNYQIIGSGTGLHWSELDEDLSLKGLLQEYLRQKLNRESELIIS